MSEHLREAVFHTLIAALVVEALLRLWRVEDPRLKLRMRLFVSAVALFYVPVLEMVAPFRHQPSFTEEWALFVGERWGALDVFGLELHHLWLAGFATAGVALLLLDLVPFVVDRGQVQRLQRRLLRCPEPLQQELVALSARLELRPPGVEVVDSSGALLFCHGLARPRLVVSRGALSLLDARELRAALAHELAHLAASDIGLGWALMAARVAAPYNPVLQVLARSITHEAERRADDRAAALCGERLSLASGLLKLFQASRGGANSRPWGATLSRARELTVEERCRRLLLPAPAKAWRFEGLRLTIAGVAVLALLFFVT